MDRDSGMVQVGIAGITHLVFTTPFHNLVTIWQNHKVRIGNICIHNASSDVARYVSLKREV